MSNSTASTQTQAHALDPRFPVVVAVTALGALAAALTSIAFAIGLAA